MKNTNENSLGDVIKELLETYRLKDGVNTARLAEIWNKSMDQAIVSRTSNIKIANGVLTIVLNSAVVRKELDFKKDQIIKSMNEALGENTIREVVLR
jgi:predicted nucleic acid-binding Zn ribbon protein